MNTSGDEAMQVAIDPKRLAKIKKLAHGAHTGISQGACAMEAVAYIAGEKFSDHPECASPVIAAFMRSWNDSLPDDERTALLLPLVPKLVGTRGSAALENRRATMAADWLVREHTPAWLRLAGLTEQADALSNLPQITDFANTPALKPALEAARRDANAARAAARAAAGSAAGSAARAAAGSAARAAARAAAGSAARAAAWDALKPTREKLQQSAVALVERMCALSPIPTDGEGK